MTDVQNTNNTELTPAQAAALDHTTPADAQVACWSCKGPVRAADLFCATCKAVQPPRAVDHYTRLGLAETFDVDVAELDQTYFDLQRRLHPDRFATRGPKERQLSQQQATALNDAYEILKDPLKRADYLVHLRGVDALPEGCALVQDQSILMEAMEMREKLAQADTLKAVGAIAKETKAEMDDVVAALSLAFRGDDIVGACQLTTRLKYLDKMMGEVRAVRARLMA